MTKTHAEFLEELKNWPWEKEQECLNSTSTVKYSKASVFLQTRIKIEQFRAEQKQVSDEQD